YVQCDERGGISVRRLSDSQEIRRLASADRCEWPRFSPDGRFLVAWTQLKDSPLRGWDLNRAGPAPSPIWESTNEGHVVDLAFSASGRQVAIVRQTGSATVCDSATGEALKKLAVTVRADWGADSRLAFHPNGRQLAAIGSGGKSLLII